MDGTGADELLPERGERSGGKSWIGVAPTMAFCSNLFSGPPSQGADNFSQIPCTLGKGDEMEQDITVRLRRGFGGIVPPICDEAANEIARLRSELLYQKSFLRSLPIPERVAPVDDPEK